MTVATAHVPAPEITVDAEGTARSASFDDVYFSRHGGVAETEHVFLQGNALPARWMQGDFTIGELGFGTGLNFLAAWRAFEQSGATGRLHFLSFEKYALTEAQLREALAHQPELARYANALIAAYPLRLPGLHRLDFGRVTLTLGFGDVADILPQTQARVDAWFLDGFAPAKNPDMWSDAVVWELTRLSAAGATLSSFTVAGAVRRALESQGWSLQKIKGFGHKREMLVGSLAGEGQAAAIPPRDALVIGAGIAGCTVARALAERGMAVTVLERGEVASGASGNPAAVLYPQLTKHYLPATAWHFSGYAQMLRDIARWQEDGLTFAHAEPGMLKLAKDDEDETRFASIRDSLQLDPAIARHVTREEGSALIGHIVDRSGFWFSSGSWIAPGELCRALLMHPNITLQAHTEVQSVKRGMVEANNGSFHAAQIVLTNALQAAQFLPLKLGVSAGQVSMLSATATHPIVCQKGYTIPLPDGLLIGATYDRSDLSGAVTEANHATNLAEYAKALPGQSATVVGGRTSMRATTPNRLPYVGEYEEGIWVSVGHGSRGMISAPFAAQVIAAAMVGEPLPVGTDLMKAISPRR